MSNSSVRGAEDSQGEVVHFWCLIGVRACRACRKAEVLACPHSARALRLRPVARDLAQGLTGRN